MNKRGYFDDTYYGGLKSHGFEHRLLVIYRND